MLNVKKNSTIRFVVFKKMCYEKLFAFFCNPKWAFAFRTRTHKNVKAFVFFCFINIGRILMYCNWTRETAMDSCHKHCK